MTFRTAVISECDQYRYSLHRKWQTLEANPKKVVFIGVNPSTADGELDDATVRKWTGFCSRWNVNSFVVVNLFAFRATNVKELATAADPVGPENDYHIQQYLGDPDAELIPCWGSRAKIPKTLHHRIDYVNEMLKGRNAKCFGLTTSGDPMHPLMLGYDTQLQNYL